MAELDELADQNIIENRSQNNIFCSRIINLLFNGLAYNTRKDFAHHYHQFCSLLTSFSHAESG